MLKGKTVVLGVTGSIAAYKMANVASMLVKLHADVHVIMTENACQFITPVTFETLTGNKCMVDTFDRNFQFHVAHISIAKKADVLLVAPASANVIGKLANGIASLMPKIDKYLYLDCSVSTIIEHMRQRGREYEDDLDLMYVYELKELYDEWAKTLPPERTLRINMDGGEYDLNEIVRFLEA